MVQAVFWEAGRTGNLSVDQPCAVMVAGRRVVVADPAQSLGSLTVTLDGKSRQVPLTGGQSSELHFE